MIHAIAVVNVLVHMFALEIMRKKPREPALE